MNKLIPVDVLENRILYFRRQKVILDAHLAGLYDVKTMELNKAVKRNLDRFPKDFMFKLTKDEFNNLRFQIGTSKKGGRRYLPYAFTAEKCSSHPQKRRRGLGLLVIRWLG